MAEEELMVVLRKSEDATFGFSLLRTDSLIGFPHVIYDIVENSPAAECGEVEAGDVIVKVNGTDVHGFTTKDVLKCLRLSTDPVTLELKRDPKIKAHVRKYLASISNQHPHSDGYQLQNSNPSSPTHYRHSPASPLSERGPSRIQPPTATSGGTPGRFGHRVSSSDPACRPSRIPQAVLAKNSWSAPQSPHGIKPPRQSLIPTVNGTTQSHQHQYSNSSSPFFRQEQQPSQQQQPPKKGFEAFMMTGDLILNLSRTPQSSGILPQAKKIDSLRDSPSHRASTKRKNGAVAPHAKCDSSPSPPSSSSSNSYSENNDNSKQRSLPQDQSSKKSRSQEEGGGQQDHTDQNTGSSIESIVNSSSKKLSGNGSNHNNNHNNNRLMEEEEESGGGLVNSKHSSSEAAGTGSGHTGRTIGSNSNSAGSSVDAADEEEENADDLIDLRSNRTNTSGCVSSSLLGERNSARRDVRPGQDGSNNSVTVQPGNSVGSDSVDSSSAAATNGDLRHYHSKERSKSSSSAASSGGGTTVKSESSPEMSYSVPTSPTSLSAAPILEGYSSSLKKKDLLLANSVPTSPESGTQEIVRRSGSGNHHHHPHHHHHHHHHLYSSNNQSSNSGGGAGGGPVGHSSSLMSASISGVGGGGGGGSGGSAGGGVVRKNDAAGFRTSRSEDHLQQTQRDGGIGALVPIEIDEDVNSSLNTLLDTRHDSEESQGPDHDRIVWTYNAPVSQTNGGAAAGGMVTSPISHSSSMSSSPQRSASDSPASPTSVSSSVMSSSGGSKGANDHTHNGYSNSGFDGGRGGSGTHSNLQSLSCPNGSGPGGGGGMDQSVSEAVSNISSPDYQDEHDLLSTRDLAAMAISDPSDSDSTILVSETTHRVHDRDRDRDRDHKIVIQVKGMQQQLQQQMYNQQHHESMRYSELRDSEDELVTLNEDSATIFFGQDGQLHGGRESSPPVSDDGSDVESLHSFHYSPKAVDLPSAERLAKRLYYLEGFKKSDVSRHLSKNNDFSRAVADEYLKFFLFERLTLDEALRLFLKQFSLSGETQERERVLVHFSKRYLDCNAGSFNSQDAVHTLTCAIMLLNTDLHGPNIGRKMTCSEFIENLSELNDGENFPKDILKQLYQAIKSQPLEWALDDDSPDQQKLGGGRNDGTMGGNGGGTGGSLQGPPVGINPFLDPPQPAAIEYKKGYVMRKCCYDTNYKKTPFGKRSWKMFYCTLRDLVLYLHKDEHGFRKNQMSDNVHNAIRIHHALATKASDYTKKQHVFRLQTADQSEYLFQTSDSKELQSWIDTINFVCASFSAPPLEGGVGSQKRFQRPLLPCTHTKLLLREQLASHEDQVNKLENLLAEHKRSTIPTKGLALQNYKEKEAYLLYELKRYKTYYYLLSSRMNSDQSLDFENLLTLGESGVLLESDEILQRNRQNSEGSGFGSAGANQTIIQQQPLGQQSQLGGEGANMTMANIAVTTMMTTTTTTAAAATAAVTTGGSASNRSDSRQYKT